MNILIISNYKDAINSVRPEGEIFIGLQKMGYFITIMTQADGVYIQNFLEAGIKIIDFHPIKKLSYSTIKYIRQELKNGAYDVLCLFNSKAISNGNFAAIGLKVKVVVYRGVIGGSSWLNPNAYLKHLHPRVDCIIAVSKAVQQYLQKQIWWNPTKVKQYYKGQNLSWYQEVKPIPCAQLGLPSNAFVVSCIANNRTWKGVHYLIEAANFLPPNLPIHFLLIGRKMDSKENLSLIKKSPYATQFHLLGYRNDVSEVLASSQVYVQPSLKNKEGLGKAILEAMSVGVPPIITNSGGPIEYVQQSISGIIVAPKNPKEIADSVLQLFQNEQYRLSLGNGARLVIKGKMNIEKSIIRLNEIFQDV